MKLYTTLYSVLASLVFITGGQLEKTRVSREQMKVLRRKVRWRNMYHYSA